MSLAARCPHCLTVFRISGPQLAAAQGWVRCGGCSNVFDAAANLYTPEGQALRVPTVEPVAERVVEPSASTELPFQAMPDIDLELPDLGELKAQAPAPAARASFEHADAAAFETVQAAAGRSDELTPAASAAPREPAWVDPVLAAYPEPATRTAPPVPVDGSLQGPSPESVIPGDLRGDLRSDTTAGERQPGVAAAASAPSAEKPARGTGGLAAGVAILALTLSLGTLLAYAARGHLVQAWPQARPWVLQACSTVGCSLPAVRLLEGVAVQGSSLSMDDTRGHHRLRVQLRNPSDWPVRMPAFDLSLIDADGQVLARRMLDPTEFESPRTQLEPGTEADLAIDLNLRALASGSIASFRVVPYYP